MQPFGGLLGEVRDQLNPQSVINCRPLDSILLPRPWYQGRILLIGDAAHSTTPHLASGAGIAVEDALMLSHLLARTTTTVEQAFSQFMDRRWARCKDVVESSVEIGALQQNGASPAKYGALIGAAELRLQADIWESPIPSSVVSH
jgi:2-polyprenyl-6-methoxyphenol hydroxylase-like FAD-dependent oxidoreductase